MEIPRDLSPEPLQSRGLYALALTNQVVLEGVQSIPGGVRVTVNGDEAVLEDNSWSKPVILLPGWNTFYLAVHDIYGSILTNWTQAIVYEAGTRRVGGTFTGSVVWNDPSLVVRVTNDVEVAGGASLIIGNGAVVIISPGRSITAQGSINVQGAEDALVRFLPDGPETWGWLMASGTGARLMVRHADVAAGQLRARDGAELVIEDGRIRDLPDTSREVIDVDDALGLTVRRVHMSRFAEADSLNTPVLVEGCLLEGFLLDGMDIKTQADHPLLIRRCTFRNPASGNDNIDAVDLGPGAGTVESCLIHDFPDKGISVGGAPGTWVENTLIYRCQSGISADSSPALVFLNTTVTACRNGILLEDDPDPAMGVATNLIVWGNSNNLVLLDSSMLSVSFSNIEGTNVPGPGNISLDPKFLWPGQDDYRLREDSPVRGAASDGGPMGVRFPIGGIPSAPERLVALHHEEQAVRLFWVDTAENEDGVLVERSADRQAWQALAHLPADAIAYLDAQPLAAAANYYRVRATNDVGVSWYSNPARAAPALPLELAISRPEHGRVVLEFMATGRQTFLLQARPTLNPTRWTNRNVLAVPEAGVVRVTNGVEQTPGFFRLLLR